MSRIEDALALAIETLELLETDNSRLTPVLLRCLRLARIRDSEDEDAQLYFNCELREYKSTYADNIDWARFAAMSGRHANPNPEGKQTYWTHSLPVLENEYELAREDLRALQIPVSSISETSDKSQYNYLASIQLSTTEKVLNTILARRQTAAEQAARAAQIIAGVRGVAQGLACET